MASKISVLIDVTVDKANAALGNFRKSISDADGAVGKFKAGAASAGDSIKANLMPIAASAGVAIAAFAAKSVSAASDLQESTNAVNKSFGEAADGVLEIGENSAESFGLSKAEFNEAAVAFSSFAQTVAGDGGNVSGTIEDMTTRAADFASVMNISVAEASTVFRSGLAGETEPLKRFGIDLSAAAVEAFALASGLVESKKEMTEAIKVQARYGLLMEKTSKFAGDFADTSDGLANSTRIAQARITDFQAEIGEQLIPTVATAVNVAMDLADALESVGLASGGAGQKLDENRGLLGDVTNAIQNQLNPLQMAGQLWNQGSAALDDLRGSSDEASDALYTQSQSMVQASIDSALLGQKTEDLTAADEAAAKAAEERADELDGMRQKIDAAREATEEATQATMEAADSSLAYRNQEARTIETIAGAVLVNLDEAKSLDEKAQASRDAEGAAYELAEAAVQQARDVADASGASLTAAQEAAIYKRELQSLASTMDSESAAAVRVLIANMEAAGVSTNAAGTQIGMRLGDGIIAGITDRSGAVARAAEIMVEKAIGASKAKAGIRSPSKLFHDEVGVPIADGVAEGITDSGFKIADNLVKQIEAAEKDAIDAADALVDSVADAISGFWGGIDAARSEGDLRDSVADAEEALADSYADSAAAWKKYHDAAATGDQEAMAEATEEIADAQDKQNDATKRLEDANYRLAKATVDMIYVDAQARASWEATAAAAGLTRQEIDGLVSAYDRLALAKANAAMGQSAFAADASKATKITDHWRSVVGAGFIAQSEIDSIGKLSGQSQLDAMAAALNRLDTYFGQVPQYATGGVVPGSPNQGQLAMVHGGETIIPAGGGMSSADMSKAVSDGMVAGWKRVQQLGRAS